MKKESLNDQDLITDTPNVRNMAEYKGLYLGLKHPLEIWKLDKSLVLTCFLGEREVE